MSRLLACAVLALATSPVAACINDVELPAHEREFRSQYNNPTPPAPAAVSPTPSQGPSNAVLIGGGAALLVAAGAVTLFGRRAGN